MKKLPVLTARIVSEIITILMLTIYTPYALAAEIYVPEDYSTIQAAIDAVGGGDEVVVSPGVYHENINFLGKAITVRSMNPDDQDIVAATIIDGNQEGNVVTFNSQEGNNSFLKGVKVQNSGLSYNGKYYVAYGIHCDASSPTITNCIISENYSYGINCSNSSAVITDCTVTENSSGIHCSDSSIVITDCTISNNEEGGIHFSTSSLNIINCTVTENGRAGIAFSGSGEITNCTISNNKMGGICVANGSPTITNCLIKGNSDSSGISCGINASPTISDCIIAQNSGFEGGGIKCTHNATPTIINCIIAQNSASISGGGIFCLGIFDPYTPPFLFFARPTIINCTITENTASEYGGGIYSTLFAFPTVINSILWKNTPKEVAYRFSRPDIRYSNVGARWRYPGRGNVNADPLFVDPSAGDYHLQPDSPCINRGQYRCEMGAYGNL